MTKSKHTKGPWKIGRDGSLEDIYGILIPMTIENARIISTAPELLQALEKTERLIKFISGTSEIPPTHEYVNEVWNEARAAIAKAIGEA